MKRILTAALFAAAMAAPALADDQATANERCVAMATEQAVASLPPETPDDQKAMMTTLITDVCGCLTTKLAGMGDDGAKVLRVLAVQTKEEAAITDPAAQKAATVALLVREFGISEEEAAATYDRVNPAVTEAAMSCQQEAMTKLQGGAAQ